VGTVTRKLQSTGRLASSTLAFAIQRIACFFALAFACLSHRSTGSFLLSLNRLQFQLFNSLQEMFAHFFDLVSDLFQVMTV